MLNPQFSQKHRMLHKPEGVSIKIHKAIKRPRAYYGGSLLHDFWLVLTSQAKREAA